MKIYVLHVNLPGTGRAWRKIEMRADQTLEDMTLEEMETEMAAF